MSYADHCDIQASLYLSTHAGGNQQWLISLDIYHFFLVYSGEHQAEDLVILEKHFSPELHLSPTKNLVLYTHSTLQPANQAEEKGKIRCLPNSISQDRCQKMPFLNSLKNSQCLKGEKLIT